MKRYYWLTHRYRRENWVEMAMKSIGFFVSLEVAKSAIEKVKDQPGFRDWPEGFRIDEVEMDKIDWKLMNETISPFEVARL